MKNRWLKLMCIGLTLIFLSSTVLACPGSENAGVPVVELKRVAPNNLDLPGIVEVALATPGEGALLVNENLRLWVPPGAVARDTPVTVERFLEPPEAMTSTKDDAMEVAVISEFYDLGPDNIEFDKPVKITIPYSEEVLPAGADETLIGPIYYDGQNWVPIERELDTVNNTVSFETESFPGVVVALAFGFIPVTWATYAITGAVIAGVGGYIGYTTYGNVVKDPLHWGKAGEYITPNDATVQQWADKAQISLTYSNPPHPVYVKDIFSDPAVLKEFIDSGEGFIQFENTESVYANAIKPVYQKSWNPNDWQKPADYFKNGMVGDCKNVANAMASIFRHYGFTAKCVDGYMVNDEGETKRHGWLEVIIDGKPYYMGSHGEIMTLDAAIKEYTLTRPKGVDGEGYMVDETGQKPYVENWWDYYLEVEVYHSLAFPGGEVVVDVFGPAGVALDIALTLENPSKVKTEHTGVTDETNGEVRFTLQLDLNAQLGVYFVTAYNAVNNISEVGVFSVTALEISAVLVSSKVSPGEILEIKVRLNKPLATDIEVDSDAIWTTDAQGYVTIYRSIPQDTQLGPYTLTLSAPAYNVSKKVNYVVWIPATLKVNITPEVNSPGKEFYVNVLIEPAQVTRITMRGYSGQWMTNQDGRLNILMHVLQTTTPGVYEIFMEAPDLGLTASDTHTVTLTPQLSGPINVVAAQLGIKVEGVDEDGEYEAGLYCGGQYVLGTLDNYQVHASGRVPAGDVEADMYYDFTLSKDLNTVTSGSVSLRADNGSTFSFTFSNLPRNKDAETMFKEEMGLDALVFSIKGTAVSSYLGSFRVNDPFIGSISRYFAGDDSELAVVLIAATDDQLTELFDE